MRRRFKSFFALFLVIGLGAGIGLYQAGPRFLFPILVCCALTALFLLFFPDFFLLKRRLRERLRPVPPSDPLIQIHREAAHAVFIANRKALPPDKGGRGNVGFEDGGWAALPPDKGGRGGFAAKAPPAPAALFTVNSGAVFALGFSRFTKNRIILSRGAAESLTKEELKAVLIYFETVFASGFGLFWTLLAVFFRLMQAVFFLAETPLRLLVLFFQKLSPVMTAPVWPAPAPAAPALFFPLFLKIMGYVFRKTFLSIDQEALKNGAAALPRALWTVQALSEARPLFFPSPSGLAPSGLAPPGQKERRSARRTRKTLRPVMTAPVMTASVAPAPVMTVPVAMTPVRPAPLLPLSAVGTVSVKSPPPAGDLWPLEPPAPFLSPLFFGNPLIKTDGGRRLPPFQPELRERAQALAKGRFPPPP